jgi:DNA-binding XRE family transcriptional regulator
MLVPSNNSGVSGAQIQRARLRAGVSRRALAKELGVSHVFLSQVESGEKGFPPAHWRKLADALPGWTPPQSGTVAGPLRSIGGPAPVSPPVQALGRSGVSRGPGLEPSPGASLPPINEHADARSIVAESLLVLRRRLRTAPPTELTKITTAIATAAALQAKLEGVAGLSEVQIVRSAPWRRLWGIVEKTLEKYPEAARALAGALSEAHHEDK